MYKINMNLVKEFRNRTNLGLNSCRKALIECNGDVEAAIDFLKKAGELKAVDAAGRIATEGMVYGFNNSFDPQTRAAIVEINCQTDFVARTLSFTDLVNEYVKYMMNTGSTDFSSLEEYRVKKVSETGENIVIRRAELLEPSSNLSFFVSYNHPGNKISVLLEIEGNYNSSFAEFANNCAMQIAAMKPLSVSKESLDSDVVAKQKEVFMSQMMEDEKLKSKPQQALEKICEGKMAKWLKEVVLLEQENVMSEDKISINEIRQDLSSKLGSEIKIIKFVRYELGEGLEKKSENLFDEVNQLLNS